MKRTLLPLLAVAAMTLLPSLANASIVLTFDDILPGQGAAGSTAGTTNIPATFAQTNLNAGTNTNLGTSSLTFNWSGLADVDGDGTNETVTFDILVSSSGNLTTNGAGLWGTDPATFGTQINTGEDITFEIANLSTSALSDPNAVLVSSTANWFDFTTNGGGASRSFSIDGGPVTSVGNNVTTVFTADEDFTILGEASDTDFRVRATSFQLNLVTETVSTIPEPSSLAILGLGGLAMLIRRRK